MERKIVLTVRPLTGVLIVAQRRAVLAVKQAALFDECVGRTASARHRVGWNDSRTARTHQTLP